VLSALVEGLVERLRSEPGFERKMSGRFGGALWLVGAAALLALPHLDEIDSNRLPFWLALTISASAVVCGLLAILVVPWDRVPTMTLFALDGLAVALIAFVTLRAGQTGAEIRLYVLFPLIHACCFLEGRLAASIAIAAAFVWVMPVAAEHGVGRTAAELGLTLPIFLLLWAVIVIVREMFVAQRRATERLTDELDARRVVATAVAAGRAPREVFTVAAEQAARLLCANAAALVRFEPEDRVTSVGRFSTLRRPPGSGQTLVPEPGSAVAMVREGGRPVRVDDLAGCDDGLARRLAALGYRCWLGMPVGVGGRLWGLLAVMSCRPGGLAADAEEHLAEFAELLAMAIANTEQVERLASDATTDPLTGLANHRAFQERLRVELARAQRYEHPLTLAVIDLDEFKAINDSGGHAAGDEVLRIVAAQLQSALRGGDVLARVGGDEFAALLPETSAEQAAEALERARQAIAASPLPGGARASISLGVCDIRHTTDPQQLARLADGALYWSKGHGRNRLSIYDPHKIRDLSAAERLEQLRRSRMLVGIRALARAIDARDPSTSQHSERVAALTARLAEFRGWEPERVARLYDAALVHDVGKLGIPDAILLKPDRLTREEYEIIKTHVELSARIVDDALDAEQVEWILSHHERPDGRGYPRALTAGQLSEGAALMAAADAFDVMTSPRPYSPGRSIAQALDEVRALTGTQFTTDAAHALLAVYRCEQPSERADPMVLR